MQRNITARSCRVALFGFAFAGLTVAPVRAAEDTWQFEITPYVFGAGLRGTTGVGQVTADIDFIWDMAAHGAYVGLGIAF